MQRRLDGMSLSLWLLGFSLGGFFDGILLHQILQWHHLLSTLNPDDASFQIAADGLFHLLMYVLALIGLVGFWMAARRGGLPSGRRSLSLLLVGFGVWHVVDAIGSHWILGIHRIRMDSGQPLLWDLIWVFGFGLLPIALGMALRMRGPPSRPKGRLVALALPLCTVAAGWQALQPPAGNGYTAVLFAPGISGEQAFAAAALSGGKPVWIDATGRMIVLTDMDPDASFRLFTRGALLVTGSGLPPGCFSNLGRGPSASVI